MLNILKVSVREWSSINALKIYILNAIHVKVLVHRYIFISVPVFENLSILIMIFREWILLINYHHYTYRGQWMRYNSFKNLVKFVVHF